jgi:ornithine carbamoyltransferase
MINEILLKIAGDQTVHNADSIITGEWVSFKVMSEITYKQIQAESVYRNIMEKWFIKLSTLIAPFP